MALTVSVVDKQDVGKGARVIADLTFDSSYPTGGELLGALNAGPAVPGLRIKKITHVTVRPVAPYTFEWVPSTGKLKAMKDYSDYSATSNPGLAIGSGSKKKVLIANTVQYRVAGVLASKTTAEVDFTATTHDIAPNANTVQEAVYAISLAANGAPTVTKGTTATGAGNAVEPDTPAANTLIGTVRIAVAAGATPFDATSDDLDAAHLTVTYVNKTDAGPREVKSTTDLSAVAARAIVYGR